MLRNLQNNRPATAKIMAPPTPTHTPMMVFRVPSGMADEDPVDCDRGAVETIVIALETDVFSPTEFVVSKTMTVVEVKVVFASSDVVGVVDGAEVIGLLVVVCG